MSSVSAISISDHVYLPKRARYMPVNGFLNPYIYDPSVPIAVVGAIIFPLICAFLVYQYIRYRSWFFWAALIGVIMEAIGFICRAVSTCDEGNDLPFLIAFLMILLAPSFLAAACYTAFSRVVWFSCPTHALSSRVLWCFPRWITPTFVSFDLLSFLIQLIGAGLISHSYDNDTSHDRTIEGSELKVTSGRVLLITGLILQTSCFLSFAIIAARYFVISRAWRQDDLGDWKMWRKLCWMITMASLLITLRAIYRTVEIPHDKDTGLKYLQSHEWCFWTFDALPILLTLVVFAFWHPGKFLPRNYTGLTLDKRTAIQQKEEIRPSSVMTLDAELREYTPRDFGGGVGMRV